MTRFNPYSNSTGQEGHFKRRNFEKQQETTKALEPISFQKLSAEGDWEAGLFYKNGNLLELRISGTTIANQPCGLEGINIKGWLYKTGKRFVKENQKFEIVLIDYNDVENGELTTAWGELRRVDPK